MEVNESAFLNISGGATITGLGNLSFNGTVRIYNGSLNNFTIKDMNYTRAWFYNSTDIQLYNWTTLPAGGSVNLTGKAVNVTNTSGNGNMSLRIYYNSTDIAGLNESNLQIFRYTGSAWQKISSTVNAAGNYTYAEEVTTFSLFALGEDTGANTAPVVNLVSPASNWSNDLTIPSGYDKTIRPLT